MTVATLQRPSSPPRRQQGGLPEVENPQWISHAYSLTGLIPPALLLLSAWLVFPYDSWISLHCHRIPNGEPALLRNILDNVEPFGHAVGVVIASLAVLLLEQKQWKTGFSVLGAGVGAGLIADFFKLWVSRVRPRNYDFATLDPQATLTGWMPLFSAGSSSQSFPSAHTATAFGMAVMLSSLYPRGRFLFFLLAIMVMGHRLFSGAHFASDILTGAAIGWIVGMWIVRLAVRCRFLILENSPLQPLREVG
jgi:membrane-associated phospholipid phosphatase